MKKAIPCVAAACIFATATLGQTLANAQIGQKMKQLAGASVDYKVAGEWFKLSRMTDNVNLKQEILKTAGAALLYAGKGDIYQKSVRSLIDDVTAFEESMIAECRECGGVGEMDGTCKKCNGTGRCTYGSCQDGNVLVRGIGTLPSRWQQCRECKGTGQCQTCKGVGTVYGKCRMCGGRGKLRSRDATLQAYRDHALAAGAVLEGNVAEARREKAEREKAFDPREAEQTAWDKSTYRFSESDRETLKKMIGRSRKSIAVNVDASPLKKAGLDLDQLAVALQADIQGQLGSLPYLRPISANRELIDFINSEWGGSPTQDVPDYILLCRLTYANVSRQGAKAAVSVKAYFEIYDRAAGAARHSTTISKIGEKDSGTGVDDTMQELFTVAAVEYMERIADKIGPIGIVAKTSGNGRYAYVSLGTEAGLVAGGRVQIMEKMGGDDDLSDLIPTSYVSEDDEGGGGVGTLDRGANLPLSSVADGHVVESTLPEPMFAWVEIDKYDPKSPRVKKGMAVRIVPMPRERRQLAPTHTGNVKVRKPAPASVPAKSDEALAAREKREKEAAERRNEQRRQNQERIRRAQGNGGRGGGSIFGDDGDGRSIFDSDD